MTRAYGPARAIVVATIAFALIGLGVVQFASDALAGAIALRGTAPSLVSPSFGEGVYRVLDGISPAPFVESTLGERALARGDFTSAQRHAIRLPASPTRDDLLARIALARGQRELAFEYFFAAADVDALQAQIQTLAASDPQAAYDEESRLKDRLVALTTHPDAVAQAYWELGKYATSRGYRDPSKRQRFFRLGMADYRRAVQMAPLDMKYVLSLANQQLVLGDIKDAQRQFAAGLEVDPGSAQLLAGLGIVALRDGDRARSRALLLQARSIDPTSPELLWLERLSP